MYLCFNSSFVLLSVQLNIQGACAEQSQQNTTLVVSKAVHLGDDTRQNLNPLSTALKCFIRLSFTWGSQ